MTRAYMRRPWTYIRIRDFFPSVNSVSWQQGNILVLSSDFHGKENNATTGAAHFNQTFFGDISWYEEIKEPVEPQDSGFSNYR